MKTLVLVNSAFGNVDTSIPLIEKLRRGKNEVLVLALDFSAARKLRQRGIPYKTPIEYLDITNDDEITRIAIEFAKSWHKPFREELTYKGIPLGEMVEYDFAFLFIDALRSIEIATIIFLRESPDEVFLPQRRPLIQPNTVCYEALPQALRYLAMSHNMMVTPIKPSRKALFAEGIISLRSKTKAVIFNIIRKFYNVYFCASIKWARGNRGKKKILLLVPFHHLIEREIDRDKALCLNRFGEVISTRRARNKKEQLRKLEGEFSHKKQFRKELKYKGIPLLEILHHRSQEYFSTKFPELAMFIERMDKNIQRINPDILVVMEDITPLQRTICRIFKLRGLPVLVIQHGAVSGDMAGFHVMPVEADKQAVWGRLPQEWGIQRGKRPESQIITGNPKFDPIAKRYPVNKERICNKLGLNPKKGIIVLTTGWYAGISVSSTWEINVLFISQTLQALKHFSQEQVVVKLHPGNHKQYDNIVSVIASEIGVNVVITKDYLWELLSICDLLICENSTVGLEAMILDKPVVTVNLGNPSEIPYASYGAALGAYEAEDIAPAIKKALYNIQVRKELESNRKKFVYEYAYIQDGQASKRVTDLIIQMIEESKKE